MGKRSILVLVLSLAGIPAGFAHPALPRVEFIREAASVDASNVRMSHREEWRVEHFLHYMFPTNEMRRLARAEDHDLPSMPAARMVKYAVVEQEHYKFVLVNYRADWNRTISERRMVSVLAIYRIDSDGPNQVWRSHPWLATYDDSRFMTAKSGWRNIVFYQEGGNAGEFGLAGVFSFYNRPHGLILRDLTPSVPWLRAVARFPFRPLYGEQISMRVSDTRELILTAHDEEFDLGMNQVIRPSRSWVFNQSRDRFEQMPEFTDAADH